MQSKIDYSPRALKDLDEIWDYIEVELCNPIAAQNTVNGIMDNVDGIAAFPESGAKLEFENGLDSGYRYVVFKNYLAFYRLRPNNVVYVDRVIYGGRDYQKRDRRYDEELRKDGRNEILAYGIAFYKKRCKVVVERL